MEYIKTLTPDEYETVLKNITVSCSQSRVSKDEGFTIHCSSLHALCPSHGGRGYSCQSTFMCSQVVSQGYLSDGNLYGVYLFIDQNWV